MSSAPVFSAISAKWQRLTAVDENRRRPGYIGKIPYLTVLRWFACFGIILRIYIHRTEYGNEMGRALFSAVAAFVLAAIVTFAVFRNRKVRAIEALVVALCDIVIFSFAYLATLRLQSDMFLFFFLPLIMAAEYLSGRLVILVFCSVTVAFALLIAELSVRDTATRMTLTQALVRVFLGREFFLLGLVTTAWYLFRLEHIQNDRLHLQNDRLLLQNDRLLRIGNGFETLLEFSVRANQLFGVEDLLAEAVRVGSTSLSAAEGIALISDFTGVIHEQTPPKSSPSITEHALYLQRELLPDTNSEHQHPAQDWLTEFLEFGGRRFGALSFRISETRCNPETIEFVKALTVPLVNSLQRINFLASLRRINAETLSILEFDRELEAILSNMTENLRMDFGAITLLDEYRGLVETVRGKNVAPGLGRLSRYPLDARDIQTEVINQKRRFVIDGPSDLFNPEIYDRLEHHKLARVWVPIWNEGEVIGTIEGGCARERKDEILSETQCLALEEIGRQCGPRLNKLRPQALLRLIAEEAMRLVNADAASIHVYQAEQQPAKQILSTVSPEQLAVTFAFNTPLHAAGAGKATPPLIRTFKPRSDGIGWQAILSLLRDDPIPHRYVDDPSELRRHNPPVYDVGIRAMLAIPLRVAPDLVGLLYIHHWSEHRFSEQELQLEKVFAGQIQVAIQSHFLLGSTADKVQDSKSLLEWLKVINAPAVLKDSLPVLEELAQKILLVADADNVVLYQYLQEQKLFQVPPILKGKFLSPSIKHDEVEPVWKYDGVEPVSKLKDELLPLFYSNIALERPEFLADLPDTPRFFKYEDIQSCAILGLSAREELFGLLFVNHRKARPFTAENRKTIEALAASAAGVIRTARFYEWLEQHQQQLRSLREIDHAIIEGVRELKEDQILAAILTEAMLLAKASAGAMLKRVSDSELETKAAFPSGIGLRYTIGPHGIGQSAMTGKPLILPKLSSSEDQTLTPSSTSLIEIPLAEKSKNLGVLRLESEDQRRFSEEDLTVLQTLATQGVIALNSIQTNRDLVIERRRAVALSRIAGRIQGQPLDLALYLILTGITSGESLGFSRAMLFLCDEQAAELRGVCAIGELDRERATQSWNIEKGYRNAGFDAILDRAVAHFNAISKGDSIDEFMCRIKELQLPLTERGAATRCVFESYQTPCQLRLREPDPFRGHLAKATGDDDYQVPFVCVPLVGRDKNLGTLVVDNRFLWTENDSIPEETLERLTAYAELAAMSVETARLLEKTQTQTYEDLAHQIRTPIRHAASQCRSIIESQNGEANETLLRLRAALNRAVRVSASLKAYADMARGKPLNLNRTHILASGLINAIRGSVEDSKMLADPAWQIGFEIEEERFADLNKFPAHADLDLLREAFEALLDNAIKYSYPGTTIRITGRLLEDLAFFDILVENTGMPIQPEHVEKLTIRDWRGPKSAVVTAEGSGIGLWVADNIMRAHDGNFLAWPTQDNRTRVGLRLPICKEQVDACSVS